MVNEKKDIGRKCFIGHTGNLEKALGETVAIETKKDESNDLDGKLRGENRDGMFFTFVDGVYLGKEGRSHVFIYLLSGNGLIHSLDVDEDSITAVSAGGRRCKCEKHEVRKIWYGEKNYQKYKTGFISGILQEDSKPDNYL